jgi:hypothetical protein
MAEYRYYVVAEFLNGRLVDVDPFVARRSEAVEIARAFLKERFREADPCVVDVVDRSPGRGRPCRWRLRRPEAPPEITCRG